jgi:hypothetical protein
VFFVLYAIRMFVFLNNLVIVLVSFPIYVNVVNFCFCFCGVLGVVFMFCFFFCVCRYKYTRRQFTDPLYEQCFLFNIFL